MYPAIYRTMSDRIAELGVYSEYSKRDLDIAALQVNCTVGGNYDDGSGRYLLFDINSIPDDFIYSLSAPT